MVLVLEWDSDAEKQYRLLDWTLNVYSEHKCPVIMIF